MAADLQEFNVAELKELLRFLKLAITGNKAELIARILDSDPEGEHTKRWLQDKLQKENASGEETQAVIMARKENETLAAELLAAKKEIDEMRKRISQNDKQEQEALQNLREAGDMMSQELASMREELRIIRENSRGSDMTRHSSVGDMLDGDIRRGVSGARELQERHVEHNLETDDRRRDIATSNNPTSSK